MFKKEFTIGKYVLNSKNVKKIKNVRCLKNIEFQILFAMFKKCSRCSLFSEICSQIQNMFRSFLKILVVLKFLNPKKCSCFSNFVHGWKIVWEFQKMFTFQNFSRGFHISMKCSFWKKIVRFYKKENWNFVHIVKKMFACSKKCSQLENMFGIWIMWTISKMFFF